MTTTDATPHTLEDYQNAATILWGDAGSFTVGEFARLNELHFGGELPPLPIVIGITAYGHCIGLTRHRGGWAAGELPRITIASNLFATGANAVTDTLLHEMIHAKLILEGKDPAHNGAPWCEEITRLSPAVLGRAVTAAPVKTRRVDGKVTRLALPGHLTRQQLARWPHSLRGSDFDPGPALSVESY